MMSAPTINDNGIWADEAYRFMTVDVQGAMDTKFYVIRAWSKSGESRLVKYGHTHDWSELKRVQKENKVGTQAVMVDSGYNTTDVYNYCMQYGENVMYNGKPRWVTWVAMNGDGNDDYASPNKARSLIKEGAANHTLHSNPLYRGKQTPLITWSNLSIKTILFHLKDGKGAPWYGSNDTEYIKHLNSESLEEVIDAKTQLKKMRYIQKHSDNHLLDCEAMQVVGAYMVGIIGHSASIVSA